jgi:hypothetical protein
MSGLNCVGSICMGSSFDINVVDEDKIVGAFFFCGDSQRFSYQCSKNLLLQKISSKFTKVVHGSNMLIRLT